MTHASRSSVFKAGRPVGHPILGVEILIAYEGDEIAGRARIPKSVRRLRIEAPERVRNIRRHARQTAEGGIQSPGVADGDLRQLPAQLGPAPLVPHVHLAHPDRGVQARNGKGRLPGPECGPKGQVRDTDILGSSRIRELSCPRFDPLLATATDPFLGTDPEGVEWCHCIHPISAILPRARHGRRRPLRTTYSG